MRPIPGKSYTVADESSLSQIAARAYGDSSFWPRIWSANQTTLRSGDPDVIFPGERILIPTLPERILPSIPTAATDSDALVVNIGSTEIRPFNANVLRTVDTVANAFRVQVGWVPGKDPDFDQVITPKQYSPAKVTIGGELILNGVVYTSDSKVTGRGVLLTLEGGTATLDLVDSTLKPPFEFSNVALDEIVTQVVQPTGFKVIVSTDVGGAFRRVTATSGDTIASFLTRLSRQRGVLITCDPEGSVVLTNAVLGGSPVAVLEEGVTPGVTGWGLRVDGRTMFNVYRATGRSPLGNKEAQSVDALVPRSRFKTLASDDTTGGDIDQAATWGRNKTTAEALTFQLSVEGWRDPQGSLWEENTLVTVISASMFLQEGFNFLINRVEYILNDNGRTTLLSFVPPKLYTQGDIEEPWG